MPKQRTQDSARGSREPWLLRVEEAAELLGVSRSSVYNLINTQQLPTIRIAGCRRIPMDGLREWITQQSE
jgi:excisionase family DNA binding protein